MDALKNAVRRHEVKRLRALEVGNEMLKEMLAEAELDKRTLKEVLEANY